MATRFGHYLLLTAVLGSALLVAGCLNINSTVAVGGKGAPDSAAAKPTAKPTETAKKSEPAKTDEEKPFDDVVKEMKEVKGLFTLWTKAEENKVYIEILPAQMEKTFLFSASIDQAVGERGLYAAQMSGDFPFCFRRVGKSIQWLVKNPAFTAEKDTPQARAMQRSFPDAMLAAARIRSKPHPERKSLLIDANDLLMSDLPQFATRLSNAYKPSEYRFDRFNSVIASTKAFPENVLFEMWLHYTSDKPKTSSVTLPDTRSVPVVFRYDLSALPDTGYEPRLADDRVGHFLSVQQDFTSDKPSTPYVRRVNRWQLEKADAKAELSEPKKPIVFWLENTVPVEYREWMTEGALLWNKAFEKIGFKNAVVVKQQPDDADWDAADTRYNTIRWFAGVDASFAIGPSRANPFTGQIYDADIGFSEGIIRSVRRMAEELVGPSVPPPDKSDEAGLPGWLHADRHLCAYAEGLAQQADFALGVLAARGALSPETEEKLMRQYLVQVTAHEVGHTLGLRHNFRASSLLAPDELFDTEKTGEIGQSSSVMDYNPIVIAPEGKKQGDFVPVTLGPYDYLAIEYAYKPIDGDEKEELAKIAARATEPELRFATDEDALGTYSSRAIDPLVNQFDQSSDPIGYFRDRMAVVRELWSSMETNLTVEGEGYQILRRALGRSINECNRALLTSSKFIGGVHHYRDHVGDPGGKPPYVPVAADRQREGLEFLREHAFNAEAFQLPPGLHNRLAIERLPALTGIGGLTESTRLDYPWHDTVLNLQRAVLGRLFDSVTLARIQDNELRFAAGETPFRMADLFDGLKSSIWSELDSPAASIDSLRRNLQREHLKHLIRLTLRAGGNPPEDATTLARANLAQLEKRIRGMLGGNQITDATSRAHLEEAAERINAALKAQMQKPTD